MIHNVINIIDNFDIPLRYLKNLTEVDVFKHIFTTCMIIEIKIKLTKNTHSQIYYKL